ncbi:MAG: hypothetical protein AAF636_18745 [Pseudomonadota bacterium]
MSFPQLLWANEFTASDVLKWGQEAQNSYFNTSVGMIAILAARTGEHGHVADCLNDWYWTDDGNDPKKNDLFREVMSTLGTYHPQAVILAVVEKHCGSFKPD